MKKIPYPYTCFLLTLTALTCCLIANAQPPNILVLIADDAGWKDFGCYGGQLPTPNIDALAKGGMQFNNAFLTSSSCSPSRTSTLTGQYAHTTGTEDMHVPLPAGIRILPSYLKEKGYFTGHLFKTHYGKAAEKQFDWYGNKPASFNKFLDTAAGKPWFMWVGFNDPHRPYNTKEYRKKFAAKEVAVPLYLADDLATRADLADYFSEIMRLDEQVGVMVNELKARNLFRNTLVIFLSDNGSPFPGCKGTLYDGGIGTPLLFHWPAGIRSGTQYNGLVSSIDLAPTLLQVAGIAKPKTMLGESLLPVLQGKSIHNRQYAFSERNWHGIDEHMRSVRTLNFKLITNGYDSLPHGSPSEIAESPSWQRLYARNKEGELTGSQRRVFMYPRPKVELYDVTADPNEENNLADDPKYKKPKEELLRELQRWQKETKDVSVHDHVPADKTDRFTGKPLKSSADNEKE